jgi:nucleotide-binding universal stress UspA family protein
MFDPILVPLDGSLLAECVLPHVVAIARAFNAKVILLRVLEKNRANGTTQLFDLLNWQIKKAEAKLYLEKISARLIKSQLRIDATVLEGLDRKSVV